MVGGVVHVWAEGASPDAAPPLYAVRLFVGDDCKAPPLFRVCV
jgi:hypothetical protein